jgi:hypothetical protein
VGEVVQPLQSVNYHDRDAHGHEQHGPFTQLVGMWLVGCSGLTGSSWFGSWYAAGAEPVCMVLGLATGVRPMSFGCFGYMGETSELSTVLATGVRPVSSVRFWLHVVAVCSYWNVIMCKITT